MCLYALRLGSPRALRRVSGLRLCARGRGLPWGRRSDEESRALWVWAGRHLGRWGLLLGRWLSCRRRRRRRRSKSGACSKLYVVLRDGGGLWGGGEVSSGEGGGCEGSRSEALCCMG